jgi:AbrB family looped-hinge helix DNA binding protein
MRITTKGQVTIPKNIRELLGITPESEVEFREENGKVYLVRCGTKSKSHRFNKLRGIASVKLSTDEIMALTRDT